jgi:hypothetical protein
MQQEPNAREFERHVRVALASLYDLPRLQTHPLARFAATESGAREPTVGRTLQRCLREAIDGMGMCAQLDGMPASDCR